MMKAWERLQVDAHGMGWETKSSHSSDLKTRCFTEASLQSKELSKEVQKSDFRENGEMKSREVESEESRDRRAKC